MKSIAKNMLKRIVPSHVRGALRTLETEVKLSRTHAKATKAAKALDGQKGLKLNFGSGPNIKPGWVNIDAFSPSAEHHWDARRPMPIGKDCCTMVYSEHMLEHLDYVGALSFFRESHRVLSKGGVFRVVLPDFQRIFQEYVAGNAEYFSVMDKRSLMSGLDPSNVQMIDYLNYAVYQDREHVCLWDPVKLSFELGRAGFSRSDRVQYDAEYDSADPKRRAYSIYFDATK